MKELDNFLNVSRNWDFTARSSFLIWIGHQLNVDPTDKRLVPETLRRHLLAPTAKEWIAHEPDNSQAHFLFAIYGTTPFEAGTSPLDHLQRAVELDSTNWRARTTFINSTISIAEYSQHELPWHGYLGSASDDAHRLEIALKMSNDINEPSSRRQIMVNLRERLEIASAWLSFEQDPDFKDFEAWCKHFGKPIWVLGRIT